jgi:hypothetical protein
MKAIFYTGLLLISTVSVQAQTVISQFTWSNSNPLKAAVGHNALSVGSTTTVTTGGANGNGLNPGTSRTDIDLTLTGSDYTLAGLDVSVDFKAEESQASFFTLGLMDFGMNGNIIYAKVPIVAGASDSLFNINNIYTVSDALYHTYRLVYNNYTGTLTVSVDGTTKYTGHTKPNTALYWTGAGNAVVGQLMDGAGSGLAVLDNLLIQTIPPITLPVSLLSFNADPGDKGVLLTWTTTREYNVHAFTIERSVNGAAFEAIGTVNPENAYAQLNDYQFVDNGATASVNYYRLVMTDMDGTTNYSAIRKVTTEQAVGISLYPNPVVDYVHVNFTSAVKAVYQYSVITLDGKTLQTGTIQTDGSSANTNVDLTSAPKGMLLIHIQNPQSGYSGNFKILRL